MRGRGTMTLLCRSTHRLLTPPLQTCSRCEDANVDLRTGLIGECLLRVFLHATDESALSNGIGMDDLKKFAAEGEISGERGKSAGAPVTPSDKAGGAVRETH